MSHQNFKLSIRRSFSWLYLFAFTSFCCRVRKFYFHSQLIRKYLEEERSKNTWRRDERRGEKLQQKMKNCDSSLIYENGNRKVYFQKSYRRRCFLLDWKLVGGKLVTLGNEKTKNRVKSISRRRQWQWWG